MFFFAFTCSIAGSLRLYQSLWRASPGQCAVLNMKIDARLLHSGVYLYFLQFRSEILLSIICCTVLYRKLKVIFELDQ